MIAKMMAPGKVVTNYCQGSTLVEFEQALLQAGLSKDKTNQVKELLTYLGERTALFSMRNTMACGNWDWTSLLTAEPSRGSWR
jgi:hypothetical protein